MNEATRRYHRRAIWALTSSQVAELPHGMRSDLLAVAVHACQSLRESLEHVANGLDSELCKELLKAINALPHVTLIESVRHMDLHGKPLPVCTPGIMLTEVRTKPGQPIRLTSTNGTRVTLRMDGVKPKVSRSPNRIRDGNVTFGGATVSLACVDGEIIVHDFSTAKNHRLTEAVRSFLVAAIQFLDDPSQQQSGSPTPLSPQ